MVGGLSGYANIRKIIGLSAADMWKMDDNNLRRIIAFKNIGFRDV